MILRTITDLPTVTTWVAMVQQEVGERFAARAGSSAYGVPSVLAQLACDVKVLRPVSRTVFHPVPNVDSVLVGLDPPRSRAGRRAAGAGPARLRAPAQGARRARSRSHRAPSPGSAIAPAPALEAIGKRADARAEQLSPDDWRALCAELHP